MTHDGEMRVFMASASFSREYGGPAYSVSRLGFALVEAGASVALWAPDGSAEFVRNFVRDGSGARASTATLAGPLDAAVNSYGAPDIIHDSGLWLPHNHALARLARRRAIPRVVSTRGMLDPWALRHKRAKKTFAWNLYQRRDLATANALHVTSGVEAANLQALCLTPPVWQISNGVDLPAEPDLAFQGPRPAPRKVLFLGRLHPVKGLPALLEGWANARPEGWELVLAGPDEAGHRALLENVISQHALGDMVRFVGGVAGQAKTELFRSADLLVLPSLSESFGMVIAEALAHGLPVLASTNVPWPQIDEAGCGWRVAAEADALGEALARITALPRAELAAAGKKGREIVARDFGWPAIAAAFLTCYDRLCEHNVTLARGQRHLPAGRFEMRR